MPTGSRDSIILGVGCRRLDDNGSNVVARTIDGAVASKTMWSR
jgi:hypothetical protein